MKCLKWRVTDYFCQVSGPQKLTWETSVNSQLGSKFSNQWNLSLQEFDGRCVTILNIGRPIENGILPVRDGVLESWTRTRVPIFGTRDSTRTRALIDATRTWTREFSHKMTWTRTRTRELSRTLTWTRTRTREYFPPRWLGLDLYIDAPTWTRTRASFLWSLMSSILACAPAARRVHVLGPAIPV